MGGRVFAGILLLALSVGEAVAAVPEPAGYRLDDYRAPVPETVAGGEAIATEGARTLWQEHRAIFIDVLPAPRRPPGMRADAPWIPIPRRDIPGSLWVPDVGRGEISPELDAHFRAVMERATHGDKEAPIVIYCLQDCWMSWNATKRAASYGYTHLYWYREGTTGWEKADLPTSEVQPEP